MHVAVKNNFHLRSLCTLQDRAVQCTQIMANKGGPSPRQMLWVYTCERMACGRHEDHHSSFLMHAVPRGQHFSPKKLIPPHCPYLLFSQDFAPGAPGEAC